VTWVPGNNFDMGATVGLISVDVCKGHFIRAMENLPVTANEVYLLFILLMVTGCIEACEVFLGA